MIQKSPIGRLQPPVTFVYADIFQSPLLVKNGLLSPGNPFIIGYTTSLWETIETQELL